MVCEGGRDLGEEDAVTCVEYESCWEVEEKVEEEDEEGGCCGRGGIPLLRRGSSSGARDISPSLKAFSSSLLFKQAAFGLRFRSKGRSGWEDGGEKEREGERLLNRRQKADRWTDRQIAGCLPQTCSSKVLMTDTAWCSIMSFVCARSVCK